MKHTWKNIMIGFGVIVIEWIFLSVFHAWFNGLDQTGAVVVGAAFFLAFEMVICTGAIISKIQMANKENEE